MKYINKYVNSEKKHNDIKQKVTFFFMHGHKVHNKYYYVLSFQYFLIVTFFCISGFKIIWEDLNPDILYHILATLRGEIT